MTPEVEKLAQLQFMIPEGETSCLSARAGMGARGGGQEDAMVPSPWVSAATNP